MSRCRGDAYGCAFVSLLELSEYISRFSFVEKNFTVGADTGKVVTRGREAKVLDEFGVGFDCLWLFCTSVSYGKTQKESDSDS